MGLEEEIVYSGKLELRMSQKLAIFRVISNVNSSEDR